MSDYFDAKEAAIRFAGGFTTKQEARMIQAEFEMRRALAEHFERERRRESRERDFVVAGLMLAFLIIVTIAGV